MTRNITEIKKHGLITKLFYLNSRPSNFGNVYIFSQPVQQKTVFRFKCILWQCFRISDCIFSEAVVGLQKEINKKKQNNK